MIVAPASTNTLRWPSRSAVYRTCSEPGLIRSGTLSLIPWAAADFNRLAARARSS
jgi:hypothetical protein